MKNSGHISSCEKSSRGRIAERFLVFYLIVSICIAFCSFSESVAQGGAAKTQKPQETAASVPSPPEAPSIGDTGFRVPIPEIKMKQIIRGPSESRTAPPDEAGKVAPQPEKSPIGEPTDESALEPRATEGSDVLRLPFEPDAGRREAVTPPVSAPSDTVRDKTERIPLLAPPAVPEDVMEATPPKKEILKPKPGLKTPDILSNQPDKGTLPGVSLDAAGIREIPTQEWIPLNPRPEMETVGSPRLDRKSATETLPREEGRPPTLGFPRETLRESPPHAEERPEPEESTPLREGFPGPAGVEELASPLASNAEMNREVKNYLMETAPILEELSLLMTRVPSLKIEDFDPSKADMPVVPNDVLVLMDSTKRALQVLDSKTFAIIPPPKYAKFHSMIRESITQTYQGCEAVMNFFRQSSEEDLEKAQDHLLKARELIQKTTKGTDKPVRG